MTTTPRANRMYINPRDTARHKCPHPEKDGHPTYEQAENALFRQFRNPQPGRTFAIRVYQCSCGKFHLTKQESKQELKNTIGM